MKEIVSDAIALGLLMLGLFLFALGFVIAGTVVLGLPWVSAVGGVGFLAFTAIAVHRSIRARLKQAHTRLAARGASPQTQELILQLFGDHTPYVIDAAEQIAASGDRAAIPALVEVLDRYSTLQPAGWHEVASPLIEALGRIGDRTVLPLLYRLEHHHESALGREIRAAIAAIDPYTSLLRPSLASEPAGESLLRPAAECTDNANEAQLLRMSGD